MVNTYKERMGMEKEISVTRTTNTGKINTGLKTYSLRWCSSCIILLLHLNYSSTLFVNGLLFAHPPATLEQNYQSASITATITTARNILHERVNINPLSSISNGLTLLSLLQEENDIKPERDEVERIIDANTIKLKKTGVVRLAYVRMPSVTSNDFQFPSCFIYTPSYKIRSLIPVKTVVNIYKTNNNGNNPPQAILIRNKDSLIVNEELVKTGFAKVIAKKSNNIETSSFLDLESLLSLQNEARINGLGIWSKCNDNELNDGTKIVEAQFEPLEQTMETIYTPDGGYQQIKVTANSEKTRPKNPGDTKGCSDFNSYEEALEWFEYYYPYYGDVAKLDRDGDGVPCPGLPHTSNRERYRMKIPKINS